MKRHDIDDTVAMARKLAVFEPSSLNMDSIMEHIERPKVSRKYVPPNASVGPNITVVTHGNDTTHVHKDLQRIVEDEMRDHTEVRVHAQMVYNLPNVQELRHKSCTKAVKVVHLLDEEENDKKEEE